MNILGHEKEVTSVQSEITTQKGGHSYLFSGPQAVGKFLVALQVAKEAAGDANFLPSEHAPYPTEVLVLEPTVEQKGEKKKITKVNVDMIREATQFVSRYPSKGTHRSIIIRDAHMLSVAAQNMLLKILEEPPVSALLILVTHEPESLLGTVRSRLREKPFQLVSEEILKEKYSDAVLEKAGIPPFFRSFGQPGVLEQAISAGPEFSLKKELLVKLYSLTRLSTKERLELAEKMATDVSQTIELLEWWIRGLREQAGKQTSEKAIQRLYLFIEEVLKVVRLLQNTQTNPRLLLEQLFFQLR